VLPHLGEGRRPEQGRGARQSSGARNWWAIRIRLSQEAEAVSEGQYGIPVVTHCCLETHGQVIQWQGDQVQRVASTQDVTHYAGSLGPN